MTIIDDTLQVTAKRPSTRTQDDYTDVPDMFRLLSVLSPGTPDHDRQRERIVTRCLPLADHIAFRYHRKGENLDDLVQIARVGLMHAVNRFDPENGANFLSFAVPTMLGEIRRHFRDNGWAMHVPRRLKDLHVQITRATPRLTQSLGRPPTPTDLAAELGADRQEVVECLVAGDAYSLRSIDSPISSSDDTTRSLADTLGEVDGEMEHITDRESLRPLLAALTERERTVISLRFFASMTQTQIAERIGVSQMQVSRILAKTLQQLRDGMS
ncbi:SigB/SigF/SigG family RNA polymerase sigma factor [Mycolicibacterium monacense]|uniref:Alternative sigma factor SigF n=4 Tax=Mycobacteriaceae TaxID=1762 RepID=A0AAD1IVI2_MYCMB|nr:SigB/SigF/SigG family RNA polymerase sigma factor [Mycolicibacterium monacense]MDA4102556.1 RNA polymerase sigma factor SigF [Mycolicibacterium monacense DSM 44395]OBB72015.1 RNA polymerase subunit sigma [Mycolicibacterium monacense]OBF49424.1 RNA polymerase subunit sigma [Mycolicibacterium monacense]ORB16917.1 RNA polymerase subunit sigma [Mycolicibacterium monacense DSM 44395]QHP86616.1 SigB/SigF/SigG family RNA polymerase sigma factor [Mycolicibacterium monacense DSM 44395]